MWTISVFLMVWFRLVLTVKLFLAFKGSSYTGSYSEIESWGGSLVWFDRSFCEIRACEGSLFINGPLRPITARSLAGEDLWFFINSYVRSKAVVDLWFFISYYSVFQSCGDLWFFNGRLDRFLQWDPRLGRIYCFSRVRLDRSLQWDPWLVKISDF